MFEFVGLSFEEVLDIIIKGGYAYECEYEYNAEGEETDEVSGIVVMEHSDEVSIYGLDAWFIDFEDGICYECEQSDWD